MARGLTRRQFVKGALLGAAALTCAVNPIIRPGGRAREAGWGLAICPQPHDPEPGRPPGERDLRLHRRAV